MAATKTIGFIGLGLMGDSHGKEHPRKGFPLDVLAHRNRQPLERLVGAWRYGGAVDAAELARGRTW